MLRLICILCLILTPLNLRAADIIGYLPSYRVNPDTLARIQFCTDVVYFGSEFTEKGKIKPPENANEHLRAISRECQKHRVKLHFCIGGWGKDKYFPTVTASPEKSARFLKTLKRIASTYQLSGIDYDWEYPRTDEEMRNFVRFCKQTKKVMPMGFQVTAAFHPAHKLPRELSQVLDRVHLMTYDLAGQHSALIHSKNAIQAWREHGTPDSKICIGSAFYARNLQDRGQVKTYADLLRETNGAAATQMPINAYFGDNKTIVSEKAALVKSERIRGIIIWEMGQDAKDKSSLLKHLAKELN